MCSHEGDLETRQCIVVVASGSASVQFVQRHLGIFEICVSGMCPAKRKDLNDWSSLVDRVQAFGNAAQNCSCYIWKSSDSQKSLATKRARCIHTSPFPSQVSIKRCGVVY